MYLMQVSVWVTRLIDMITGRVLDAGVGVGN